MPAVEPDVALRVPAHIVEVQQTPVHLVFSDHDAGSGAGRPGRPRANRRVLRVRTAHRREPFGNLLDLTLRDGAGLALRIHGAPRPTLRAGLHPLDDQAPAPFVVVIAEDQLVAVAADAACLDE